MTQSTIDAATFEELKATAGADFVRELVDTFLADARDEPLHHFRRPIRRNDLRAKAGGGKAQAARSGGDVEEPVAGAEARELERRAREIRLTGRDVPIITRGDRVPRLDRGDVFRLVHLFRLLAHGFVLSWITRTKLLA